MAERVSNNDETNGGTRWSILEGVPKIESSEKSVDTEGSEKGRKESGGKRQEAYQRFLKLNERTKGMSEEEVSRLPEEERTKIGQQFEAYWEVVGAKGADDKRVEKGEKLQRNLEGLRAFLAVRGISQKELRTMSEEQKNALGEDFEDFHKKATERQEDFGKYLSAHGMTREDMSKMTEEQQLALADDFEEYRRMKAERMDYLAKQMDDKRKGSAQFYIDHNRETVRRELDFRAKRVREERDGIRRSVGRMEDVLSDEMRSERGKEALTEGQRGFVDMSLGRERKKLENAEKQLVREETNAERNLTKEQKENIERAEENIRRFQEEKRLGAVERKMWGTGVDKGRIDYSVEQKRVMDESALLTKMKQEYKGIPGWKFGERRAMKKRIEQQKKTLEQAVKLLTGAQAERGKQERASESKSSAESVDISQGRVNRSKESAGAVDARRMVDIRRPKHMGPERRDLRLVNEPKHMRWEDSQEDAESDFGDAV
ncbi:MAG: hypothetical protein Q4F60_02545 [Candidatus Saccharibacteria bacterium]|nr:hypothetical protein [Candidatus Saccharibacteria bacterium]